MLLCQALTDLQGCNRRLDPLLSYPAWVRRTVPTGISNDAMGAVPQHPFFLRVIDSLQSYDRNWQVPYITVMYSTGPLFLSVVWKEYIQKSPSEPSRVRVLMPDEYNKHAWSFFNLRRGSSWHGRDARFIFWVSLLHPLYQHMANSKQDGSTLDAHHRTGLHHRRRGGALGLVGLWTRPPSGQPQRPDQDTDHA